MDNNESDWEETNPEELRGDQAGEKLKETAVNRQALTPKVIDLMEKISEYGYLTMHEVQFIFGNKTWAYKVVKGLRGQGFIADHDTLMSPRTAHYLTTEGYRALGKLGRLKVGWRFKPERYTVFIFRHRMACAKVGLMLEKHPLVHEYLPESRLWKRGRDAADKLCDGEFWYKVAGHEQAERVGLEVELTLKSKDKLDESFRQLGRRRDLDQVWWICSDENVRRALRREVQRRPDLEPQRHFFALLDEFLAAKGRAELMEPNGTLVSIDPDKPTLFPRQPEPPSPPTPKAELMPAAQAEAPRRPQPAPPIEVVTTPKGPSLAYRCFSAIGEWVADSWGLERDGWSGSRRLRFYRWPHVSLMVLMAAGAYGYRVWPKVKPLFKSPPPTPKVAWKARQILNREALPGPTGTWDLDQLTLRSHGDSYRLYVRLINARTNWCGLLNATVSATDGKILRTWRLGHWIWPRRKWEDSFAFKAPRAAGKFTLEFTTDGWDCGTTTIPIEFK